ncbi:hypothetical protein JW756_01190 [Candidatus Woesearchaeota archaeon]|nr:hypothetical protein [Candidatus Woesearchaeota archaeon]
MDKQAWGTLLNRIYGIRSVWDDFLFKVGGRVSWFDPEKTRCIIEFNLFSLRIFSNSAVIGVIAHEFAHVWMEYEKSSLFRDLLVKFKIIDLETKADEIAIKWGFKKEIADMRNEMVLNHKKIPFKNNYSAGEVKNKYLTLSLRCPNCKRKYLGRYWYNDIPGMWCSIITYDQEVSVGIVTSEQPMTAEDMINDGVYCTKCKKSKLIIKKRNV